MQPHPWRSPAHPRNPPLVLLALLVLATACTPTPQPSSVTGSVVDADTLAPLVGTTIVARIAGSANAVASTTSDAQGDFTLGPLTAGVHDVAFEHFGYAPQARANVTTLPGAIADLGDVALAAYAPSRLYGSAASDEEFSMPLTGVRVDARIAGTATVIATDFTDEHGAFDLDPVPAGTYDVELSRTGYVTLLVEGVVAPAGGSMNVGDRKLVPSAP